MWTTFRTIKVMLLLAVGMAALAADLDIREIKLRDGTEIPVAVFPAAGKDLVLWLPHGLGKFTAEEAVVARMARRGIEVWRADLLEAHFLPPLESSLDMIPDADVAGLIAAAHRQTGKRIYLLASARAGMLALRGARAWQVQHPQEAALAGTILLHPNLFYGPPEPGKEADYHPIVAQSRLPIFILQPEQSLWRWRLGQTVLELEQGGSKVFTRLLPGVRDRFYFRPSATPKEEQEALRLPEYIEQAIRQLQWVKTFPVSPARKSSRGSVRKAAKGKRGLRPYTGDPEPAPLRLRDLAGKVRDLRDYRGRVVLVNFWASWCPPCVYEMPSMQRLKEKMHGKPFAILAVNMAEDAQTIRRFLAAKAKVDFTILQDGDGAALKRWKVFVFPTSYLIAPSGKISHGAFGEVEWDREDVVRLIEKLMSTL